uniref:Uncharacterized protein n=1 Tax=Arundo donax TaxID=35708 RepID=A0A0A9EZI0_ARUDO
MHIHHPPIGSAFAAPWSVPSSPFSKLKQQATLMVFIVFHVSKVFDKKPVRWIGVRIKAVLSFFSSR